MYHNRSKKYREHFYPLKLVSPDKYSPFIGKEEIAKIKALAAPLKGKSWININSTFLGGGVAEMLNSVVPFARGLGIDCRWFCIEGTDPFFSVTKKFHNMLQGVKGPLSIDELFYTYVDTLNSNFTKDYISGDFIVVHDPQPAGAILSGRIFGNIIWRCHIDTTEASRRVWRFLLPYLNHYDGAVFTMPVFAKKDLNMPLYCITPSIDPLKEKNKEYSKEEALAVVAPLFKNNKIDIARPYILAVSRYDIHKNQKTIIRAFKKLNGTFPKNKAPQLIIVGNVASDDPEGGQMYKTILKEIGSSKNIFPLLNIPNNDMTIGALMHLAECFVHISTKEGFGLVVTEAMWQGTPVIGSNVGGITKQVIKNRTGFVVDPMDTESVTKYMLRFLMSKAERNKLGQNSKEHVRSNFLMPSLVKNYLYLMRYYLGLDKGVPESRINNITYNEIRYMSRTRKSLPFHKIDIKRKLRSLGKAL